MSTDEPLRTATETEPGPGRPNRPRFWPRRLRILRRLAVIGLVGLLLTVFAVGVVRTVRMLGLPDVGDPFPEQGTARDEVRARIQARPSAQPEDAAPFYLRAAEALVPLHDEALERRYSPNTSWTNTPKALQEWLGRNAEPLRLLDQGAEAAAALPAEETSAFAPRSYSRLLDHRFFRILWLAVLEASRLEEQGDMQGAWAWYRALLRATYHLEQEAGATGSMVSSNYRARFQTRIHAWAEDPRTSAALLRQALADVEKCRALQPSELDILASHYREVSFRIDRGVWSQHQPEFGPVLGPNGWEIPQPFVYLWWQGLRFLDNEPERSRRVVRLAFTNWKAWLEQPEALRPRPAVRVVVLQNSRMPQSLDLYPVKEGSPPAAQRVPPDRLAEWFGTTRDARFPLASHWSTFQQVRRQDRNAYRTLLIRLGEQLYQRDHGELPPRPEALVGSYLNSLPSDGSSELDDGTTPTRAFP